jgi:hypothetical protein
MLLGWAVLHKQQQDQNGSHSHTCSAHAEAAHQTHMHHQAALTCRYCVVCVYKLRNKLSNACAAWILRVDPD